MLRGVQTRSDDADHPTDWRFSLQDPQSGGKQHFADLEALLAFLQSTFEAAETSPETPHPTTE